MLIQINTEFIDMQNRSVGCNRLCGKNCQPACAYWVFLHFYSPTFLWSAVSSCVALRLNLIQKPFCSRMKFFVLSSQLTVSLQYLPGALISFHCGDSAFYYILIIWLYKTFVFFFLCRPTKMDRWMDRLTHKHIKEKWSQCVCMLSADSTKREFRKFFSYLHFNNMARKLNCTQNLARW